MLGAHADGSDGADAIVAALQDEFTSSCPSLKQIMDTGGADRDPALAAGACKELVAGTACSTFVAGLASFAGGVDAQAAEQIQAGVEQLRQACPNGMLGAHADGSDVGRAFAADGQLSNTSAPAV